MSNDKPFRGRLLLVGAVTALALSVGGVAYAVSGDEPGADAGYVQIVDGSGDDRANGRTAQNSDGWDCPEKRGGSGDGNARNAADRL
jgi:hypothetical protein